jgi:hypothetical protein
MREDVFFANFLNAEKNSSFRSQNWYPKSPFQIYKKKTENMKKLDAGRFKKVRFSQPFGA